MVVDIFVGLQIVPKANFQPGRALESTGHRDAVGAVMKVNGGSNSGHTVAGLEPHAELSDLVAVEVFAKPEEYIVNEHMESDLGV